MGVIRWVSHVDYVARWSLWLHHPWAIGAVVAGLAGSAAAWMIVAGRR
jgi:hypothetical protein